MICDVKTMFILRGLPGSGKSTLGELIVELYNSAGKSARHISADDFFVGPDGTYKYVPTDIGRAHDYSQNTAYLACRVGHDAVIIANTTTRESEIEPYLEAAREYGYRVVSLIVENRHGNPSVHGVPEKTVEKMRDRFEVKL